MAPSRDEHEDAQAAANAARARLRCAEQERSRIDALVDRGQASFADLARAGAVVRQARLRLEAAERHLSSTPPS